MTRLIDSSIWVALFLDFDSQHKKAVRLFEKLPGGVSVPYAVVSEVATVLAYKHSKKQADQFLEYITDNKDITLIDNDLMDEIFFYVSIPNKISFTDAALLYLSKKLRARLITFDKQLDRIAKK